MSNKREKKKKATKKVAKNKHINTLKLDNDVGIPTMAIFMKDSRYFNIINIDINKVNAKPFMKESNSYNYYIFYKDDDKYIPLNICFSKMLAGYYHEYTNENGKYVESVSKSMKFVIDDDDDLIDRINDIFKHIEEKLDITL